MAADLPLTFTASLGRRLMLVGLGLAMVAASVISAVIGPPLVRVVGVFGVCFFGAGLGYCTYRLVRPRPSLIISEEGFVDNASAIAAGFVPWSQVERIAVTDVGTASMVAIKLTDPDAVTRRAVWWRRYMMRANQSFGADLYLPETTLPIRAPEAVQILNRAHASYLQRRLPPPPL